MIDDSTLVRSLAELADELAFPDEDLIVADVLQRLATPADDGVDRTRRPTGRVAGGRRGGVRRRRVAVAAAVIVGVTAALPGPRAAIAGWFGRGRVVIVPDPSPSPVPDATAVSPAVTAASSERTSPASSDGTPPVEATSTGPNAPVDFAAAAAALDLGRPLSGPAPAGLELPGSSLLGSPDLTLVDDRVAGGAVSAIWRVGGRLPESPVTGVGGVLTVLRGSIDEGFYTKFVGIGTTVSEVVVGDASGLFIAGGPHRVVYVDRDGEVRAEDARLAANVLVWTVGDLTYRFESALDSATAVAVAESFERS